ncbi:hypothetical protein CDD81_630 [Ophiocordyceps australis]|uniref:Ubiquitin carboxyl-terminal hydrolase n=1 Tax=Ophiocordyceps australis TaxID=1399860 RepID=A0A2C5Y1Z7_9HYPO|nr:hypothetical protein CDD81_630 [Ophiocordyceps australis]
MSHRHLPAGQTIHHQAGAGGVSAADIAGGGGGARRRQPQYMAPQHYHQHMGPVYQGYMPYGPQGYYPMPAHFQPSPGYVSYQNYARSPPSVHQYVPMVGVSIPSSYPRASQQSPSLATPYQPPSTSAPLPPQTPSSTHSSQMHPPHTPPTPQPADHSAAPPPPALSYPPPYCQAHPLHTAPAILPQPFRPPLPWYSRPELSFPPRAPRCRRRRKIIDADSAPVSLPSDQHGAVSDARPSHSRAATEVTAASTCETVTNLTSDSTQNEALDTPTTPENLDIVANTVKETETKLSSSPAPTPARTIMAYSKGNAPVLLPVHTVDSSVTNASASHDDVSIKASQPPSPHSAHKHPSQPAISTSIIQPVIVSSDSALAATKAPDSREPKNVDVTASSINTDIIPDTTATSTKPTPKTWAGLFTKSASKTVPSANQTNGSAPINGTVSSDSVTASSPFSKASVSSLAEAVRAYRVGVGDNVSLLEPRGLINTGNMCYMNSVLQVLMFCTPFYNFLNHTSKRAVHSFKSETPLFDAMVMFSREFKPLASASSSEQLQRKLKIVDFEKYGEPFTPEFVYDAIRQLPRFASMRRGHQQDAEEFLGFLLQSLGDECIHIMSNTLPNDCDTASILSGTSSIEDNPGDWLEVGRRQRASTTRSSGSTTSTPVSKIFGGLLRSEFRVPGVRDSITLEPYQPLQLDIQPSEVRNVVDALRVLTRPEHLQGDFNSPRGKNVMATKQVHIETLPPVLILHLKRFQFEAEGGIRKIWKKVGYPLELEIPTDVLSRQQRHTTPGSALPKYRLISVVYHHGKNASGGHYTVDVRRQDGSEWIRMDDTVIRRVRTEEVAEGGSEEESKQPRSLNDAAGTTTPANRFGAISDEDAADDGGWKQVTPSYGGKRWSNVVNGTDNGSSKEKPQAKNSFRDSKVAYLLFYQRV